MMLAPQTQAIRVALPLPAAIRPSHKRPWEEESHRDRGLPPHYGNYATDVREAGHMPPRVAERSPKRHMSDGGGDERYQPQRDERPEMTGWMSAREGGGGEVEQRWEGRVRQDGGPGMWRATGSVLDNYKGLPPMNALEVDEGAEERRRYTPPREEVLQPNPVYWGPHGTAQPRPQTRPVENTYFHPRQEAYASSREASSQFPPLQPPGGLRLEASPAGERAAGMPVMQSPGVYPGAPFPRQHEQLLSCLPNSCHPLGPAYMPPSTSTHAAPPLMPPIAPITAPTTTHAPLAPIIPPSTAAYGPTLPTLRIHACAPATLEAKLQALEARLECEVGEVDNLTEEKKRLEDRVRELEGVVEREQQRWREGRAEAMRERMQFLAVVEGVVELGGREGDWVGVGVVGEGRGEGKGGEVDVEVRRELRRLRERNRICEAALEHVGRESRHMEETAAKLMESRRGIELALGRVLGGGSGVWAGAGAGAGSAAATAVLVVAK